MFVTYCNSGMEVTPFFFTEQGLLVLFSNNFIVHKEIAIAFTYTQTDTHYTVLSHIHTNNKIYNNKNNNLKGNTNKNGY